MLRLSLTFLLSCASAQAAAQTLAAVQARHNLHCAVIGEAIDWNKEDLHGNLAPLGEQICHAMAVAVLGRADAVQVVPAPAELEALKSLQSGQVDVVVGATPSDSVALRLGVTFGPPVFWDSQTFLVHKASGITSSAGLAGRTVCFIEGTDNEHVLLQSMQDANVKFLRFPFQEEGEMDAGLVGGHCRAISAYASKLAEVRTQFHGLVHDFVLLPDRLALLPASIVTRQGDAAWSAVAKATVDTLVEAQMLGITQANLAQKATSDDPRVQHLLGQDWSAAQALGLAHTWGAQIIAAVGNYGEIFQRTLGEHTPMNLEPGLNQDCLHGGLLCSAPVR